MAVLPILILLLCVILLWLIRRSHVRLIWLVSVSGVFASWLSSLILTYAIPAQMHFIVGATEKSTVVLLLDSISWPFLLILATLLFSWLLTAFVKNDEFTVKIAIQFLLVAAAGIAVPLAGNVLSFVLTWMILDLTILTISLNNERSEIERQRAIQNFGLGTAASILIMTAEIANLSASGADVLTEIHLFSVYGMLSIAVLVRSGLFARRSGNEKQKHSAQPIYSILSTAAGFALLARMFSSAPLQSEIRGELRILGAIIAGFAIVVLLIKADLRMRQVGLGIIGLSVVLLMEAHAVDYHGRIATNICVLIILSLAASHIPKPGRNWLLFIPGVLALMLIGLPGSFGSIVAEAATNFIQNNENSLLWVLALIVLFLYGARMILEGLDDERRSDTQPAMQTTIGLLLIPVSGFASLLVERRITFEGGAVFAALASVMLVGVFGMRRLKSIPLPKFNFDKFAGFLSSTLGDFIRPLRLAIQGSAALFEGEPGMLWVYVILLFLFVAYGIPN